MNVVTLVGNIGSDVEVKNINDTTKLAEASLATNDGWGDNKKTNWHNLAVWGKTGEAFGNYVTKGTKVAITGEIEYQSWEDNDGNKRYKTVIRVNNWEFAGGGADNTTKSKQEAPAPKASNPSNSDDEDTLPF